MTSPGAQGILSGDRIAFSALIQQMLSPQNEQRQAAEAVFVEVKSNANLTVTNLLGLLKRSPDTESRAFCAVMLRKVALPLDAFQIAISAVLCSFVDLSAHLIFCACRS